MAELYDILKDIQDGVPLLIGGAGATSSFDKDGKLITPSLNVGVNQRITANESGVDTTISVKSGGAAGSAAIFLLKSDGSLRGALFYDENSDKIFFQSASGDMDFQVPAAKFFSFFKSGPDTEKIMRLHVLGTNGGSVDFFISDRDPSGVITGNPGDLVFRADGISSRQYIHEGSGASNDDWAEISTMPPGSTNIHSGTIQDVVNVRETPGQVGHLDTAKANGTYIPSPQPTSPALSIAMAWDGKKLFIGDNAARLKGYDLTTPWDITSAGVETDEFNPGFSVQGVVFSPDGLTLIVNQGAGIVRQANLTAPWDLTTATTFASETPTEPAADVTDISISPDGHNLYLFVGDTGTIHQYFLTVAFQIASIGSSQVAQHSLGISGNVLSGDFSNDGTILILHIAGTNIRERHLGIQWDITSLGEDVNTFLPGNNDTRGIVVRPDGTRFYTVTLPDGGNNSQAFQFDLGLVTSNIIADSVSVGAPVLDPAALLQINSTTKGFLLPRMTTTQRDAISSPPDGLEIFNTTNNEPEFFNGATWESSVGNESLLETLNHGNITGGSDIELSNGDSLVSESGSSGFPLEISAGIGAAGAGGAVNISAGDGTFAGGEVVILGGRTTTSSAPGGRVNIQGGQGVLATRGGDLLFFGGLGGNTSGPGGDISLHAGDGGGPNGDGGDLSLEGGIGVGSGSHGNILIADNGARVAVGHNAPDASALLDIASTTLGFLQPRMTQAQRDAIPSPAEGLSVFNTDRDHPEFRGFSEWRKISVVSALVVEIFKNSDLDQLATAGVITVPTGTQLTLDFKGNLINSATRYVLEGSAQLRIKSENADAVYLYSGTGVMISGNAFRVSIDNMVLVSTSSGTFLALTGATFNVQISAIIGFDDLGTVSNGQNFIIHQSQIEDCSSGFIVDNMSAIEHFNVGLVLDDLVGDYLTVLNNFKSGTVVLTRMSGTVGPSNALVKIDPGVVDLISFVSESNITDGQLFNTSGGTTGAFTDAADAAIALTTIDSVTDSSGVPRFNFTVGPTMYVNQEVDISNFVTETSYNQTGIITAVGAGFFEIASIAFTANDATGDFSSNSITLTETATTLSDGDTLVIDTDEATNYDGGATVYNKQTNSFQINRTFTTTHTGTWDTSGIDFRDPRVFANSNPGFQDSKKIAFGHLNGHVGNESLTNGLYVAIGPLGFVQHPSSQRFKHISDAPEWEYTGNEPFDGLLTATIFATKTGSTANYRFSVGVGGATPVFATAIYAPMEVKTSKVGITLLFPLQLVKDDTVRIYKAGDGTSDTIDITDLSVSIQ